MIIALLITLVIFVMAMIGYWDFRKGQREQEVVLHVKTDPIATSFNEIAILNNRINALTLRVMAKHFNEPSLNNLADLLDNELEKRIAFLRSIGYVIRDFKVDVAYATFNQHD